MKKNLFLILGAVTLICVLNSCKSDVLDLDKTLKFSKLTVEEQKQSIEQNGINLINKVEGLKDTKAMVAMLSFSSKESASYVKPISQLRAGLLRNDIVAIETFNQQLRVAAETDDDVWGIWTWNFQTNSFDYKSVNDKSVTYLFPATEDATTNTGELKMVYTESTVVAPDTDPAIYMPKTISVVLKVSGQVAMKADFSGSYKTDGTPVKVTQTLEIEKYNWKIELTNNDKEVSAKYAFNYDKDVLLKYELGAAGSFTATNIENSMDSNKPEDIMSSGAMYFQVMDVAVLGGIKDFKGYAKESKALTYSETKAYSDKVCEIYNKYIKMYGYFVKENKKFADVEFYTVQSTEIDYTKFNYQTQEFGTKTVYDYQPRFVLSDGSKVAIEDFFATGFDDLIKKLESLEE